MNKTAAAALAILASMTIVVENGESVVRGGRAMIYNKLGKELPTPEYYYYYDSDTGVKHSSRVAAKKVGKLKPLRWGRAPTTAHPGPKIKIKDTEQYRSRVLCFGLYKVGLRFYYRDEILTMTFYVKGNK